MIYRKPTLTISVRIEYEDDGTMVIVIVVNGKERRHRVPKPREPS